MLLITSHPPYQNSETAHGLLFKNLYDLFTIAYKDNENERVGEIQRKK